MNVAGWPHFNQVSAIRGYQNEVNSLKNDSKLKHMRYWINILFQLDNSAPGHVLIAKSLVFDNQ